MALANYYNRRLLPGFTARRYAEIKFRGKQYVESAEANEVQGILQERIGSVGDGVFGAISLRKGGTIVIDQNAGTVRINAAQVWAGGYLHDVPEAILTGVPMTGTVAIGIAVTATDVDEVADPDLRGIVPSIGSKGQPLGGRVRYDAVWARSGDPFYPIFTIIDGQIPNERTPPSTDIAELLVERHIRETHGSHIAEGFDVSSGGFNDGTGRQTFIIGAGVLRAEGRRVARSVDQRYERAEDPELVVVNGETHFYPDGGVVALNNGPIANVSTVTVIKEVVQTITHQLANGVDSLPNSPVYKIMAVNAGGTWNPGTRTFTGGTNYAENTSWVRQGDAISWAPAGAEPSAGSSFTIVYRYVATVTPQEIGRQSIALEAAVQGEPVTVSYSYKLPRIDVIAINLDGEVVYIPGIPSKFNPIPPPCPLPLAPLCRVSNLWGLTPIIEDVDQRKMTEAEVRAALRTLLNLSDLVSQVTLERDIQERDPASRRGSFVDPFESDAQRDLGIAQDAAIGGGFLMLPIDGFPVSVNIGTEPISLPYVREAVISQPFRTASRLINQFQNFTPLPSPLTLEPAIDRWNETQRTSSSSATRSFRQEFLYMPETVGTPLYGTSTFSTRSSSSTSVRRTSEELPFLRSIVVKFTVRRMGPNENLESLFFDGINVTAGVTGTKKADAQGVLTGTFTIPPNVRAGTKQVRVRGAGGSNGETSFTGQGTLTIEHYHTTTHTQTVQTTIDPVAQSFVLDTPRQITGARVEFTARGNSANHVVLEMRDMDGGLPGQITYAEGSTPGTFILGDPAVVKPENWTEILFRFPTTVPADSWRWLCLLTDDALHQVAFAQLGDQTGDSPRGFDPRLQQWVRANPAAGDMADGSNGASWRLLPDSDLTHEVMAARYTALSRTVSLGSFKLSDIHADGISDLVVLLITEEPSVATRVRLEMVRASGEVISFEPNGPLHLEDYLTETVEIRMVLNGTTTLSPIVMPECQIIFGRLKPTARYVSEANAIDLTNGPVKIRTVMETQTPGTSSVTLDVGAEGAWTRQTVADSVSLGDGWVEREHLQASYNSPAVRSQIILTGTPRFRPAVRKLRQRATEV